MKSQTTLGSFISLMLTLAQVRHTTNVPDHSQPEVVPLLPLVRFMVISLSRQPAEQTSPSYRVFRYSSSHPSATSSFMGVPR